MRKEMRGSIEYNIDHELEFGSLEEDIKWFLDVIPIHSEKDLILGYVIGKLIKSAWIALFNNKSDVTTKDLQEVREIIQRRIPEINQKILSRLNK